MQRKALLISIASAVLGTLLLRAYLQRFEEEATGGPRAAVLVLSADLAAGDLIGRESISSRDYPASYRDSRHIAASDADQVIGARLAVPGRANESLLWTDLSSARARVRQLSGLVPEGMRAMTLESAGRELQQLLNPGDRVDVLGGSERALDANSGAIATVAEDLLVLAIGVDLGGPAANKKPRQGAVTLSVTPEQGRALASAERKGPLRLVLRNLDDLALSRTDPALKSDDKPEDKP